MSSPFILFIASWYPNKVDPTLGIFIRRHAEAVAIYRHVKVLYFTPDKEFRINKRSIGNIEEIEVCYHARIPFLSMYFSFMKAFRIEFANHLPEIIHAHVALPAGFLARSVSKHYGIPYLITEHWTGYLPRNGSYKGFFRKLFTRKAIADASYITPVSEDLVNAMKSHDLIGNYKVLFNVAHPVFFNEPFKDVRKKFIHISSLDERQKNISGLLKAFKQLQERDPDVHLIMAGDGPDRPKAEQLSNDLDIRNISYHGNIEAEELAGMLTECCGLILFSNYENLPCVIIEAFACGTPVISTDVGGIAEILNRENGILIKRGDEDALINAMKQMITEHQFSREKIRSSAFREFSYEHIGKEHLKLYESMKK